MSWPIVALIALIALAIGLFAGYLYRKNGMEKKIGQTEEFVANMLEDATHKAEEKKKEAVLEAKEEILKMRTASENERAEAEKELRERRNEVQRSERHLEQREETLDKREDTLNRKSQSLEDRENNLNNKFADLTRKEQELEELKGKQIEELERVAAMTRDEAKQIIIEKVQKDAYHDAAALVRDIEAQAKEDGEKKARNIVALAIQKCAADHVAETTVSVINLPNDDMKGRIIGREGRNIRALETATGVDLIIDDTPEAVIVSAFDPVRREVARLAVEKLIENGHENIAVICSNEGGEYTGYERFKGYRDAMEAAGLAIDPDYLKMRDHSIETGYESMKELLLLPNRPSAVFMSNYEVSLGAVMAVNESGLSCPEEISI